MASSFGEGSAEVRAFDVALHAVWRWHNSGSYT